MPVLQSFGFSEVPVSTPALVYDGRWIRSFFLSFEDDDDDVVSFLSFFLSFLFLLDNPTKKKVLQLLVSSLKVLPMHTS
jgi:hypothetical protein